MTRARTVLTLLGASALLAGRAAAAADGEYQVGADPPAPAPTTATPPATATATATATPTPTPTPTPTAPAAPPPPPPRIPVFTPAPPLPFTPPAPPADVRDASADRVVFLSTAYTHPAGTVYFTDYDVAVIQAGYAVTDTTQISVTSTIPVEGLVLADATVKTVIAHDGPVRVAALGSVTGLWGLDVGNEVLGRVGAVTEMCFDAACRSSASAGATVLLGGPTTVVGAAVGFIWRAVPWLGVLAEAESLIPTTLQAGHISGVSAAAGIRIPHRAWSLDLALARPFAVEGAPTIPFVAFTIRFLP